MQLHLSIWKARCILNLKSPTSTKMSSMEIVKRSPESLNKNTNWILDNDNKYIKEWSCYINDLTSSVHISDAIIYDQDGTLLATSQEDFNLSKKEYADILEGFRYLGYLERKGISINGQGYKVYLNDDHFGIMGKAGFPAAGCSICKTRKLLIVAVHKPGMSPAVCNEAVMNMGDFFIQKDL